MHEIWVRLTSQSYPIQIDRGLLDRVGPTVVDLGARGRVAMVSNPKVDRLYGKRLREGARRAGLSTIRMVVPDGERYKTLQTVKRLYDGLIAHRTERSTFLLALGGGVIGDLAGFTAATYLRGIPLVQVPTSLVAQVDASIGGKTGVDHPKGKNLVGSFYQPRLVAIDPDLLTTLSDREYRAGLSEVVKYGVIADSEFFAFLEKSADRVAARDPDALFHLVRRCCEIKAHVVQADERESGQRRILNFGHSLGHVLETLGGYKTYLHGEAVAIGMVAAARMAVLMGMFGAAESDRLASLLRRFGLEVSLPKLKVKDILKVLMLDKKVSGGKIHLVLPEKIGLVRVIGMGPDEAGTLIRKMIG